MSYKYYNDRYDDFDEFDDIDNEYESLLGNKRYEEPIKSSLLKDREARNKFYRDH